jgi:hypothetical protein
MTPMPTSAGCCEIPGRRRAPGICAQAPLIHAHIHAPGGPLRGFLGESWPRFRTGSVAHLAILDS